MLGCCFEFMETTEKKLLMFQMLKTKLQFGYYCGIFSKNDSLLAMYCSKSGSMLCWQNKLAASEPCFLRWTRKAQNKLFCQYWSQSLQYFLHRKRYFLEAVGQGGPFSAFQYCSNDIDLYIFDGIFVFQMKIFPGATKKKLFA